MYHLETRRKFGYFLSLNQRTHRKLFGNFNDLEKGVLSLVLIQIKMPLSGHQESKRELIPATVLFLFEWIEFIQIVFDLVSTFLAYIFKGFVYFFLGRRI